VRNKFGCYAFSDEASQVGSDYLHPAFEIFLDLLSEFKHFQSFFRQLLKTLNVEVTNLLAHRSFGNLYDSFCELAIADNLFDIFCSSGGDGFISDEND
jgi:hypothetical protein